MTKKFRKYEARIKRNDETLFYPIVVTMMANITTFTKLFDYKFFRLLWYFCVQTVMPNYYKIMN